MNFCTKYPCGGYGGSPGYCHDPQCPLKSHPLSIQPTPSPRFLPVNIPFSIMGKTVVTMDRDGNVTIKVDQPEPN